MHNVGCGRISSARTPRARTRIATWAGLVARAVLINAAQAIITFGTNRLWVNLLSGASVFHLATIRNPVVQGCIQGLAHAYPRHPIANLHTEGLSYPGFAVPKPKRKKKQKPAAIEMSAAEATAATLMAHGLDTVYALPGIHNDHLFDAFQRAGDQMRVVHPRHEQGAAYMALGAALATGKPQAYVVVPGPGLLNSGAALLTAYGMNAPGLAIIGQIPAAAIGKSHGHLHEIRDQAGILARLVGHSFHIHGPDEASIKAAKAIQSMSRGRPGPAALECAIDVWSKRGPVPAILRPSPARAPRIDDDKVRAPAKVLAKSKHALIVPRARP